MTYRGYRLTDRVNTLYHVEEENRRTKSIGSPGHGGSQLGKGEHSTNWYYNNLVPLSVAKDHGCDHYEANHESDHPYPYKERA